MKQHIYKKQLTMKFKPVFFIFFMLTLFSCSSDDEEPKIIPQNKILSFKIVLHEQTYSGSIDHVSKVVRVQSIGLEQNTSIVPEIEISENATIYPASNAAQNFNETVEYLITAESGEQVIYKIDMINETFSTENSITSFKLSIEGEEFIGEIDENSGVIDVICFKDVSDVIPEIEISDLASISAQPSESFDFNEPVSFTVTAQDGSTKTYDINMIKQEISASVQKCYIRATSFGRVNVIDLKTAGYELFLENELNSYPIDYFEVETWTSNEILQSNFQFIFREDIVTATDYKLKFRLDGKVKAETPYTIDVLAENAPKIESVNQTGFYYEDTLILTGENLQPGLRIPANFNIYNYSQKYIDVNEDQTKLSFFMNINRGMFPGGLGQDSPRPTRVSIYYDGRYGDFVTVDFY